MNLIMSIATALTLTFAGKLMETLPVSFKLYSNGEGKRLNTFK